MDDFALADIDDAQGVVFKFRNEQPVAERIKSHMIDPPFDFAKTYLGLQIERRRPRTLGLRRCTNQRQCHNLEKKESCGPQEFHHICLTVPAVGATAKWGREIAGALLFHWVALSRIFSPEVDTIFISCGATADRLGEQIFDHGIDLAL